MSEAQNGGNVMKRLTTRDANCADPKVLYGVHVKNHDYISAANRLADYEDTGLTPEQCENAKTIIESAFSDDTSKVERIRELLKADKDGRLVVLPCKVGDTVYILRRTFDGADVVGEAELWWDDIPQLGKTVFMTREEAAKALEAMKDGNG